MALLASYRLRLPLPADLCLIADRPTLGAARVLDGVAAVLAAVPGRVMVIDRGADGSSRARLSHLARLRALCGASGAWLMVSGRVDLALASGADGVHLPESGLPPEMVREAWPWLVVGRSCHDRAGLETAAAAGAHYALLAPVAAPTSKPASGKPLGINGFADAVRGLALPVLALGGVTPALANELRAAGAAGLASLGGVLAADDPAAVARAMLAAWDAGAS